MYLLPIILFYYWIFSLLSTSLLQCIFFSTLIIITCEGLGEKTFCIIIAHINYCPTPSHTSKGSNKYLLTTYCKVEKDMQKTHRLPRLIIIWELNRIRTNHGQCAAVHSKCWKNAFRSVTVTHIIKTYPLRLY